MRQYRIHEIGCVPLEIAAKCGVAILQLAMVMAAADGRADPREIKVIQDWGERLIRCAPKPQQYRLEQYLNAQLERATRAIDDGREDELVEVAVCLLIENGTQWLKYEAYEFCLEVLVADEIGHPEEVASLALLSRRLGLLEAQVRRISDCKLAKISLLDVAGDRGRDQYLGITSDMTLEEVKRHLNGLFRKYSARTAHDDPDIAERARDWLQKVGEARARYFGR